MHFLITNDDGVDAPGLLALYQALVPIGRVTVAAPAVCHSSRGHAVDTKNAIRIERRQHPEMGRIAVIHSSPADCVRIGLCHVVDETPDVVVAGINPGANLGIDLYYSGTAAAAREASIMGVPSFALSRYVHAAFPIHWDALSRHAERVMRTLLTDSFQLPRGVFWNVNFPACPEDEYPEAISFVPHGTLSHEIAFETVEKTGDQEVVRFSGDYSKRLRSEFCDVGKLFDRHLTATAVGLEMRGVEHLPVFKQVSLVVPDCVN